MSNCDNDMTDRNTTVQKILDKLLKSLYCMEDSDHYLEQPETSYDETVAAIEALIAEAVAEALEALLTVKCPATLHDYAKNEADVVWVGDINRILIELEKHGSSTYLAQLQAREEKE